MKPKLAELLLRRKELQGQVDRLKEIDKAGLFEIRTKRISVNDGLDDITAQVPRISMKQATHCYDWHARQLRLCDAAIQQANWTTEVEVADDVMSEYVDPYVT